VTDLRPRRSRLLTVLGLLLLVVPPVVWWSTREAPNIGALPDTVGSSTAPSPPDAQQPPGPELPRRSGLLSAQSPPAANATPARLRVPSIGVDAGVVPVGIDPFGAMEIPADVDQVGWYRFGPAPGDPGTAVLAGHVDSRTQGRGAFFDLRRLDVGDLVVVETDGSGSTWEVVARRQYAKDVIPLDEVFTRGGPPRLALITCGGDFDGQAGRYLDNVVVYTVPTSPGP
jgi:sortase (surface protein transpeptidase)